MKFLLSLCSVLGAVFTLSSATTADVFYHHANTNVNALDFDHLQLQPQLQQLLPNTHVQSPYILTDEHVLELKPIIIPHEHRPLRHRKRSLDHNDDHEHTPEMDAFACHSQDSFLYGNSEGIAPPSSQTSSTTTTVFTILTVSPPDGEQHIMANMTIIMQDGRQLVSMERFEPMTKRVRCGEKMMLEFVSRDALEYAVKAWNWVNDEKESSFVMVANHEGCGVRRERVPYK